MFGNFTFFGLFGGDDRLKLMSRAGRKLSQNSHDPILLEALEFIMHHPETKPIIERNRLTVNDLRKIYIENVVNGLCLTHKGHWLALTSIIPSFRLSEGSAEFAGL